MGSFLGTVCLSLICAFAHADWNRFRGTNGSGIAEGDAPLTWSSTQHIAWKTRLPGPGTSSPIVVGGKVFVTCWSGYGDGGKGEMSQLVRHLVCLDKADGHVLRDRTVTAVLPEDPFEGMITEHGYASSTPTSDGEAVYVFFGKTGVLAFDMEGHKRWQTSVGNHSDDRKWGSAASPVLYGDLLIVNALTEGGAIVALDKRTGREVWKSAAGGVQLAFSTPVIAKHDGVDDIVVAVPQRVLGLNPAGGQERWHADHGLDGPISPGVLLGGDVAYVFGGSTKQGSMAVRIKGNGNVLWQSKTSSYVPTPVFHDGFLYVINDQGFALCLDASTGKQVFRERVLDHAKSPRRGGGGQPFYASPVLVNGRLYCPSRRNGTFVIAAKPQFELLAINDIQDDESQFNASPAADGNRLYLRSDRWLYCVGE